MPSGPCFLKIIIGKASIDTKAKVLLLRETISNLHVKMNEYGGDVRKFNIYVENVRDALAGRGQTVDELTTHLFKAYEQVSDEQFLMYIRTKRDKYDEEGDISADELMRLAQSKYDLIKHRAEAAALSHPDPKDKIIALEAQLLALKASSPPRGPAGKQSKKAGRDPFAWKKVKPKDGDSKIKTVGGKQYHWCDKHKAWTVHSPSECRLNDNDDSAEQLVLTAAYNAILTSMDE